MPDEKKIKTEELSDEQMDQVTGGGCYTAPTIDPRKKTRRCANPNCNATLPFDYQHTYCKKCLLTFGEGTPKSFSPPKPIDLL